MNGAILSADRLGNMNKAYSFNGSSTIAILNASSINIPMNGSITISVWVNKNGSYQQGHILGKRTSCSGNFQYQIGFDLSSAGIGFGGSNTGVQLSYLQNIIYSFNQNTWIHFVGTFDGQTWKLYENGLLKGALTAPMVATVPDDLLFGGSGTCQKFVGQIDDIGIWNRALTQQEITALYQSCNLNASISPATALLNAGANAQFTATSSDPSATYQWQTNGVNLGWQNVPINTNYSGATSNSLTINNVQLANHLQSFRVIATAGNCVDTSATAFIQISDTCVNTIVDTNYVNQTIYDTTYVTVTDTNYVTIYDTVTTYISVTDTLFIDINTVGLNSNPVLNTVKVFPNPSNSILNLNYGNYATLNNYRVKITNALGQTIYDQAITQQTESFDLSAFGGNGIYYLSILNPQGNVVEVRKIVLQ